MKTEIYLIRHAEPIKSINYKNTIENEQIKNEKLILSINGEKQAENLSKKSEFQNIDLVISSNYVRAISTAKYIASTNTCELLINSDLGERIIGSEKKQKDFWLEQMLDINVKAKDGESHLEVRERMLKVINSILKNYKGKRIALVSHAAAITFLLLNWCNLEDVKLEGKKRKISFNNKIVIDDSFNTPEVFKLVFNDDKLTSVDRILLN